MLRGLGRFGLRRALGPFWLRFGGTLLLIFISLSLLALLLDAIMMLPFAFEGCLAVCLNRQDGEVAVELLDWVIKDLLHLARVFPNLGALWDQNCGLPLFHRPELLPALLGRARGNRIGGHVCAQFSSHSKMCRLRRECSRIAVGSEARRNPQRDSSSGGWTNNPQDGYAPR